MQRWLFLQYDKYSPSSTSASITRHHAHAPEVKSLMSTCRTVFEPYAAFIPDLPAFCAALQTLRPCCLRVNTLRTTPGAVRELLMSQGYSVISSPSADELLLVPNLTHPGRTREALLGYYHPQAFTSALVSRIVAPQPGDVVT